MNALTPRVQGVQRPSGNGLPDVLYRETVHRILFVLLLGFLVMDATGLEALLRPEPCTSILDSQPDATCPPTCVRCACGVQVIVPSLTVSVESAPTPQTFIDLYSRRFPRAVPSKIFHVPKFASPDHLNS
jgi:hypothetical protein